MGTKYCDYLWLTTNKCIHIKSLNCKVVMVLNEAKLLIIQNLGFFRHVNRPLITFDHKESTKIELSVNFYISGLSYNFKGNWFPFSYHIMVDRIFLAAISHC